MFRRITMIVLALALVLTGFWGYREHKQKQALLLKAENHYQSAFHSLSDHMNTLQDELGKSLAVNSQVQLTSHLTNAWRFANEAHNDVGQLPLSLMPFNNTTNFLNDIGNFTYRTSVRSDGTHALNAQEWNSLHELYQRSKGLEAQLNDLQSQVLDKNLRWMDAELALSQTEKKTDNQIVDGFKAMEKQAQGLKAMDFGPTFNALKTRQAPDPNQLPGTNVSPTQAQQIVQKWLGLPSTNGIVVQRNGQGNLFPSYTVTVERGAHKQIFTVSVKGGHITNYQSPRDVATQNLDLDQGAQKAEAFLKLHNIDATEIARTETYANQGVYDIIGMHNGVRVYSDHVVVNVALDNGEIIGVNAQDYAFHNKPRTIPKPKLTEAQARKMVSPHLKVQEVHLAIVQNDLKNEELVYEYIGTMDDDTYKVYISAMDGKEVGVEKMG